eukprot:1904301-Prymnesium_polylepis.1
MRRGAMLETLWFFKHTHENDEIYSMMSAAKAVKAVRSCTTTRRSKRKKKRKKKKNAQGGHRTQTHETDARETEGQTTTLVEL